MYTHNLESAMYQRDSVEAGQEYRSIDGRIHQSNKRILWVPSWVPSCCVSDLLGRHSRAHPVLRSPIRLIEPSCEVKRHVDSHVRTKLQNRSWAAEARTHKKARGREKRWWGSMKMLL